MRDTRRPPLGGVGAGAGSLTIRVELGSMMPIGERQNHRSARDHVGETPVSDSRVRQPMSLIKSKHRVADHGEVFTPAWMVAAMLDLVKDETERIDSRFLEPACGSGNFLVQVLRRKLAAVQLKYGKSDFERRH